MAFSADLFDKEDLIMMDDLLARKVAEIHSPKTILTMGTILMSVMSYILLREEAVKIIDKLI